MKRVFTLILCLALLPTALGESYLVGYNTNGEAFSFMLLLDEDGTPLTPRDTYAYITAITPNALPSDDQLYAATSQYPDMTDAVPNEYGWYEAWDRMALLDARGNQLTGFDYSALDYDIATDTVLFTLPNGRVGVMDRSGSVLVEANYARIVSNGEGGWLALDSGDADPEDSGDYAVVYIAPDGQVVPTGLHTRYSSMENRLGAQPVVYGVRELDDEQSNVFVDAQGRQRFGRGFSSAYAFQGNLAVVASDPYSDYGLIDRRGRIVAGPIYDYVTYCGTETDGVYACITLDGFDLIDPLTGAVLASRRFPGVSNVSVWWIGGRLLEARADGADYWYDFDGNLRIVEPDDLRLNGFYSLSDATLDCAILMEGDYPYASCHIGRLGRPDWVGDFQDLSGGCWQEGQGRLVFDTFKVTDDGGYAHPDWATLRQGVCDQDGNILLEARYSELQVLGLDRFWVRQGSRCGMIDATGRWLYAIDDYEYLMD